jgi:hypothetical protein
MATASTPPEPKKRTELGIEKIVHPGTEPEVITEDQLGVPNPPKVHNSAQSTYRRNEPCTCGSGQKYQRCCLGKPVEHPLAASAWTRAGHGKRWLTVPRIDLRL